MKMELKGVESICIFWMGKAEISRLQCFTNPTFILTYRNQSDVLKSPSIYNEDSRTAL